MKHALTTIFWFGIGGVLVYMATRLMWLELFCVGVGVLIGVFACELAYGGDS